MPKRRLDNRTIKAAISGGERVELWDSVEPGLHVVVTPAGAATFYVRYRTAAGRRRFKVGRYGHLTVDQARKAAKGILADAERGEDPQAERKQSRAALTVSEAFDRFGVCEHEGEPVAQYGAGMVVDSQAGATRRGSAA